MSNRALLTVCREICSTQHQPPQSLQLHLPSVVRREAPPHPSFLSFSSTSEQHIIFSTGLCCPQRSALPDWSNPQMEGKMPFQAHLCKDTDVVGKALQAPLVPFETRGEQMSSTFEINYSKTYCIVLSSPSFSPDPLIAELSLEPLWHVYFPKVARAKMVQLRHSQKSKKVQAQVSAQGYNSSLRASVSPATASLLPNLPSLMNLWCLSTKNKHQSGNRLFLFPCC